MRFFHLLLAVLFLLFAYWQLNDPDWPLWLLAYGFVATVAGWHFFGRPPKTLVYLGLTGVVLWWATLVPDFADWLRRGAPTITGQMQAEAPYVELTREFLGLLLCGLTLAAYAWGPTRRSA